MEYFRLKQDTEYRDAPVIPEVLKQIDWRYVTPQESHRINNITVFQLAGSDNPDFLDLLDRQLFLVSGLLKRTMDLYEPTLHYKSVILVNKAKKLQQTYHLPIFPPVECLSKQSIMAPDKLKVKHLVINQAAIAGKYIFKVKQGYENIIIARLDAVESILRRGMRGIKAYRVDLEK